MNALRKLGVPRSIVIGSQCGNLILTVQFSAKELR